MGRKLDALLRRNFRTAKFKTLVNLAVSRTAVLKNQRQVRCSQARSDTIQLLNLGHQDRALLRVEVVIREQNMLDVFVMLEGYCHVLSERVVLIENNKECPDELKEAISSLIFAASRCGEFPELQEIRSIFASRFGKDFAARAVELRNDCGVNQKMIQKLSTRPPSREIKMKVLQEIASENGLTLHLEEEESVTAQENENREQADDLVEEVACVAPDERTSGSLRSRKKYQDVASAAQAAFESAAYAAAAARAAVELSRADSQDNYPNDGGSPAPRQGNGSSRSGLRNHGVDAAFGETEHATNGLGFEKIHSVENSSSDSDGDELQQNHGEFHTKNYNQKTNKENMKRSLSASSLESAGDSTKATKISSNVLSQSRPSDSMVFDESDDETGDKYSAIQGSNEYGLGLDGKSSLFTTDFPETKKHNTDPDSEEVQVTRLNIERRPISVRNKRGNGW